MDYLFIVVGVGGTGSLLARDLPKLLIGTYHKMLLVDGDIVERKNMIRQSYQEQDIGENKAVALAAKINTFYDCQCEVLASYVTKDELIEKIKQFPTYVPVLIGCVDNDATRKILESTFHKLSQAIYLDSANFEFQGNIYTAAKNEDEIVGVLRGQTYRLESDIHPADKSCQEQVAEGNTQYLITNLKMAMCLLEHCHALITGKMKVGVTYAERFGEVHL